MALELVPSTWNALPQVPLAGSHLLSFRHVPLRHLLSEAILTTLFKMVVHPLPHTLPGSPFPRSPVTLITASLINRLTTVYCCIIYF